MDKKAVLAAQLRGKAIYLNFAGDKRRIINISFRRNGLEFVATTLHDGIERVYSLAGSIFSAS